MKASRGTLGLQPEPQANESTIFREENVKTKPKKTPQVLAVGGHPDGG